ncbi:hypothetical protein F2P81_002967 [Scophthalmus maximus]|uniref:Uncharacterized protein n=1 Tax=Scophthalmus maximus TaxID=52904 RepID=A0A6A4TG49_SCOMX|nr:hypothetical protein F2P81_002967 [Scophthalmus maximus]
MGDPPLGRCSVFVCVWNAGQAELTLRKKKKKLRFTSNSKHLLAAARRAPYVPVSSLLPPRPRLRPAPGTLAGDASEFPSSCFVRSHFSRTRRHRHLKWRQRLTSASGAASHQRLAKHQQR